MRVKASPECGPTIAYAIPLLRSRPTPQSPLAPRRRHRFPIFRQNTRQRSERRGSDSNESTVGPSGKGGAVEWVEGEGERHSGEYHHQSAGSGAAAWPGMGTLIPFNIRHIGLIFVSEQGSIMTPAELGTLRHLPGRNCPTACIGCLSSFPSADFHVPHACISLPPRRPFTPSIFYTPSSRHSLNSL